MAANKVACPGLLVIILLLSPPKINFDISYQMLLEVEADLDMSNESDSLMDRVMVGVITTCRA